MEEPLTVKVCDVAPVKTSVVGENSTPDPEGVIETVEELEVPNVSTELVTPLPRVGNVGSDRVLGEAITTVAACGAVNRPASVPEREYEML